MSRETSTLEDFHLGVQEQQTAEEQLQLVQLSVADLVLLNKAGMLGTCVTWIKYKLDKLYK